MIEEETSGQEAPEVATTIDDIIARVAAEAEAEELESNEVEEAEVGPEDESLESGEETEEVEDTPPEEDDESAEGELAEEEGEDLDQVEEEEEEEASEPNPLQAQVEALQARLDQMTQLLLAREQAPKVPEPPQPKKEDLPLEVVQAALFGGSDAWQGMDEVTKRKAQKVASDYAARESRYALDPAARYEEIRDVVLSDVAAALKPVIQDYHDRQAKASINEVVGSDLGEQDKGRLAEIFQALPGSRSGDWGVQKAALQAAAAQLRAEKQAESLAERERAVAAREKQQKANKRSAKRRGSNRGSTPPKPKQRPTLKSGDDLVSYYKRLQEMGG